MDMKRILVTNDDGMFAPGIKALVEVAREFGKVVVVAPDSPQSGKGHAVTLNEPLRLNRVDVFDDVDSYECTGTPVDCVKLAKNVLLKNKQIDLCLSGINHGSNSSINIIYSGTMSAAMEASLEGITAIGFSLLDYSFNANFDASKAVARSIIAKTLELKQNGKLLSVNIPNIPFAKLKGIKVCEQGEARWVEEFVEGIDPRGQKYYWLTGKMEIMSENPNSDEYALANGYVSVVPSHHNLTDHNSIPLFKSLEHETLIEK